MLKQMKKSKFSLNKLKSQQSNRKYKERSSENFRTEKHTKKIEIEREKINKLVVKNGRKRENNK